MILLQLLLALSSAPASLADDVVFTADENDIQAFDKMLADQHAHEAPGLPPKPTRSGENFGAAVRDEARKLRESGDGARAMGSFVSEQRRRDANNRGKPGGGSDGSGVDKDQMSDMRAFVSEKKGGSKSNSNNGHGHNKD